ncbi:MAG: 3-methyl-2-oxobutanoate hydroxymethyltransferase [Treponema sp.]|nr:3-methyl-2-oxobutanoate hydroxymethyltransferase [Treponema sp.]
MSKLSPADFPKRKAEKSIISMVTCYDYTMACLVNQSNVDCVLVGDSLANVMHGEENTIPATVDLMALHTRAVHRGLPDKFLVSDMPFLSTRLGIEKGTEAAGKLIAAGADSVKIEGADGNLELISHLVESGIPVMGHLGLTPQFFHAMGGYKVQGRSEEAKAKLIKDAKAMEEAGCFALVAECVPADVATAMALAVSIPVIGIGGGADVDGQVLVLHDMLGLSSFKPKFVRHFMKGADLVKQALNEYDASCKDRTFPSSEEMFSK